MNNKINSIQVLGSGCSNCKKLFELTKQAVGELKIEVEVEYVNDVQKIIDMGVMSTPVLAINNKPVLVGQLPGLEKIKEILSSDQEEVVKDKCCGYSCGGNC